MVGGLTFFTTTPTTPDKHRRRYLNGRLYWWFVAFRTVDDDTGSGTGRHFSSLAAAISVQFHQTGQIESRLLQHLHLQNDTHTRTHKRPRGRTKFVSGTFITHKLLSMLCCCGGCSKGQCLPCGCRHRAAGTRPGTPSRYPWRSSRAAASPPHPSDPCW